MTDTPETPSSGTRLPRAKIKRTRWRFPLVWIVPAIAAVIAVYVAYDRASEFGPNITITFNDSSGVVVGQTPIKYRGVQVGEVTAVVLTKDLKHAMVKARLRRSAAPIARDGSIFWVVRPEVGIGNITGLETVLTGPEIQAVPGGGEPKVDFVGLENPPQDSGGKGLKIVLHAARPGFLRRNSPVYYHGIEVGAVQDAQLSSNATSADIHVHIKQRYAPLVHGDSVFWNVSGVDVSAGLFRGVEVKVESLRSLWVGGIAFATPGNSQARRAKDGAVFPLYSEAKKEWQEWAPQISLPIEK